MENVAQLTANVAQMTANVAQLTANVAALTNKVDVFKNDLLTITTQQADTSAELVEFKPDINESFAAISKHILEAKSESAVSDSLLTSIDSRLFAFETAFAYPPVASSEDPIDIGCIELLVMSQVENYVNLILSNRIENHPAVDQINKEIYAITFIQKNPPLTTGFGQHNNRDFHVSKLIKFLTGVVLADDTLQAL